MSVGELTPAVVTQMEPDQAPPRVRMSWIVNARTDLPWFIGGALGGYALFAMHAALGWDMFTVWLVWYVLLDIPHFFGTYVRTYLDREEMRRRRTLLLGSLGWLIVGPMILLLSYGLYRSGLEPLTSHYQLPYLLLFIFVSLWAYWHVVRQHYGIMALYKRKNHDVARVDFRIDQALLYVGLLAPLAALIVRHPQARVDLGLPYEPANPSGWEHAVVMGSVVAVATAVLVFLLRQVQLWQRREPVNLPKALFLLTVVPLHVFVCYHPAVLTTSLLSFSAFVTIFHDLQYHAIVWHTQRNRFGRPGVDRQRYGLAAHVSRHFLIYMTCAVLMGVAGWWIGCNLGVQPGCIPMVPTGDVPLFGAFTLQHLFFVVAIGFIMHHYFVDQFIWRPSKDKQLRQDLAITEAS